MTFDPLNLARPEIASIVPYVSDRQPNDITDACIYLDANESTADGRGLNRYPDTPPAKLYERLANIYDVDTKNLLVTRGSDDAIDSLIRTFCAAGKDAVITMPPTFPMYKIAAQIQGASCIEVPLDGNLELNFNELQ
ncbi:MAG: aminotransferase class I/II-fold pyridoxal phosphate-dependent enzyme, partial [Sphingomonadales bacterium]|nr:aminotransferase class I/II-fold pyridoxal phosphate-dependent enzyme [Sphingomonadales bacterium]